MKCDAYFLQNIVQHYPWGEETAIPELLGIKADGRPFAELWMGDHPRGPSKVLSKEGKFEELGDLLSTNPEAFLGSGINGKYGGRLPFLLRSLRQRHLFRFRPTLIKLRQRRDLPERKLPEFPLTPLTATIAIEITNRKS